MKRNLSAIINQDLKEHYPTKSAEYFVHKYDGLTLAAVYSRVHELKVTRPTIYNWDAQKEEMIKDYNNGMNLSTMGEKYHHYDDDIRIFLEKNGVKIRSMSEIKQLYVWDKTFFKKIDTPEKAYWLGFIYADGNVRRKATNSQGLFQIALSTKDTAHLEQLKKSLKSNHPLHKDRSSYRFAIPQDEIFEDLIKLGCIPRKSLILKFPNEEQVPKNLISAFMLGYFDGDGCVQSINNNTVWSFQIIWTYEICYYFQQILMKETGIHKTKIRQEKRCKHGKTWYMIYGGGVKTNLGKNLIKKIYNFLYEYYYKVSCLERKHQIFEKLIKYKSKYKIYENLIIFQAFLQNLGKIYNNYIEKKRNKQIKNEGLITF